MPALQKSLRAIPASILILTAGFISGCTAPLRSDIPEVLAEPCPAPELTGDTYADVIRYAYRQRIALAECSARMDTIRRLIHETAGKP